MTTDSSVNKQKYPDPFIFFLWKIWITIFVMLKYG